MKQVVTSAMKIGESEITIDGYVHYEVDFNYGADADGNRGHKTIFVEDVTDISGYDDDLNKVALTQEDKERASEILTQEFLEN